MMKNMRTLNLAISAAACTLLCAPTAGFSADASAVAAKYNCQTCHAVDKKLVGPAYKEIAAKYEKDAAAPARLQQKVKAGSTGVWGPVPMPPTNVPDADLKTIVAWILAQK